MQKDRKVLFPPMDLTGMVLGYWTINGPAPPIYDSRHRTINRWYCTCRCGNEKIVRDVELRRGGSLSCGCYNREVSSTHHESKTRLYEIWHGMKQRCNNLQSKDFCNYGGRGIKVFDGWNNSFDEFHDWALCNGYSDGLSLDRINVNGNYCPENCRWASVKQQARNTRKNHLIKFEGQTKPMVEWAEEYNIDYYTLAARIYAGWPVKKALTHPIDMKKSNKKKEGIRIGT